MFSPIHLNKIVDAWEVLQLPDHGWNEAQGIPIPAMQQFPYIYHYFFVDGFCRVVEASDFIKDKKRGF